MRSSITEIQQRYIASSPPKKIEKALNVRQGFTVLELLIAIVVIAILASMSLVAYNGIQTRAEGNYWAATHAPSTNAYDMYVGSNTIAPADTQDK